MAVLFIRDGCACGHSRSLLREAMSGRSGVTGKKKREHVTFDKMAITPKRLNKAALIAGQSPRKPGLRTKVATPKADLQSPKS